MPKSQKNNVASRTASSPRGKSPRGGSGSGRTQSKGKATSAQKRPFRREAGAVICLLLAVFAAFGYFHIDAVFIHFFATFLKGLFGYGFWLSAPALLLASYILAFHRGRPVKLRVTCALLVPLVFSGMVHGLIAQDYPWDSVLLKTLWETGLQLQSGGVISGVIAQACVRAFSPMGCTILMVLFLLLLLLGAFDRSLMEVAEWLFHRPEYEPEQEPGQNDVTPPRRKKMPVEQENTVSRRRVEIDIPVEDGPLVGVEQTPKKKGFFDRKNRVPTPDEVLAGAETAAPVTVPKPEPIAEVPVFKPEQVVLEYSSKPEQAPAVPPVAIPEIVREEALPKVKRAEIEQEAEAIAQKLIREPEARPYEYPPLSLLKEESGDFGGEALVELNANKQRLSDTIHSFGIEASIVAVVRGPSVTRYELELDQGVRLNRLTNLADDIALALGATGVRIAPIPDKISVVGIEVPNKLVSPVSIHSVIGSQAFQSSPSKVSFAVGKDIGGNCIVGNIAKMPHLLIAGTTGSGKSVCTNSLIISMLYKATPEEVRLIMVDPKMVELGIYNGIPHLLIPVVTDPKKAAGALQWAVTEMMKRYRLFADMGVRDLASYNALAEKTEGMETLSQIVVIIDELADLMLVAAKEVEESICRVAQMGRASGMHLVIATQRPSADVITGLMKANIPSRIAFAVSSAMESRIILDTHGAEKLVGRGDMLFFPLGTGKPTRVQGCMISDQEVSAVVEVVKASGNANYSDQIMQEIEQHAAEKEKNGKGVGGTPPAEARGDYDELIDSAIEVVVETGQASVSMLQRRLKLGYARAARLVDQMEELGIVGPFEGSKPRQLLMTKEQWQERQMGHGAAANAACSGPLGEISYPPGQEEFSLDMDGPPLDLDEEMDRAEEDTL